MIVIDEGVTYPCEYAQMNDLIIDMTVADVSSQRHFFDSSDIRTVIHCEAPSS